MEVKKPKWSECIGLPGSCIQSYKPGKPFNSNIQVTVGMEVLAKYGDNDVHMEIIEDQQNGNFLATIKFFEPINVAPPKDLSEGDYVQIDSGHICCIFGK